MILGTISQAFLLSQALQDDCPSSVQVPLSIQKWQKPSCVMYTPHIRYSRSAKGRAIHCRGSR